MNIAVIGLGLIGGSMALELKHKGFSKHIIGVDNNSSHKDQALELKIVDEICDSYLKTVSTDVLDMSAMPKSPSYPLNSSINSLSIMIPGRGSSTLALPPLSS